MRRHKLMVRDIHQEIPLGESLDDAGKDDGHDLEGGGSDGALSDENTGVEIVLLDQLGEVAHMLYAQGGGIVKFDPDCAGFGYWFGV